MIWYSTDGIVYAAIFQQLNHNNDYLLSKRRHFVKTASEEPWGGGGLLAFLFGDKFLKFGQNLTY